jgi:DNA-binding NarL/FixJ family response regulator
VAARTVLVVDDSSAVRSAVCELFTRAGDFEVCAEAEDGRDAIAKARWYRPALIVTDLSMPLMDGLAETRILRKIMPDVPIILFSAHIDSFIEKQAFAAGASEVISKSDSAALLISTARELLGKIAA